MAENIFPLQVFIGSDHRGFKLAEALLLWGKEHNLQMYHLGATSYDSSDDYVDYALAVTQKVRDEIIAGRPAVGVVICGSGAGVDIVANKTLHIRCCLGFNQDQVRSARNDDDVNMLALAADYTDIDTARKLMQTFISTPFNDQEPRYVRRKHKIENITII